MQSLSQEIQGFSKTGLKKQSTRVTTVTGRQLVETRGEDGNSELLQVEEPTGGGVACGFVQDLSLDLQVGVVRPFLLLSSQDAAQDIDTLRTFKVSHVLNLAWGVANPFPDLLLYRTVSILDLPDTDITSYFPQCCAFIEQMGVVLVHCNAGASRAPSVVIGYLMDREGLGFDDAFAQVKAARPAIQPNPGFLQQLRNYKPQGSSAR